MKLELYDSSNLNFVEFNITGDKDNYLRCDEESKFLDTEVFNVFTDCFENSNILYDYIEPTQYGPRKIVPLLNELKRKEKELADLNNEEQFHAYISQMFLGDQFLKRMQQDCCGNKNWSYYLRGLLQINKDLIELVDQCIQEERILYVLGY